MATGFESHLNVVHIGKQTSFDTPATPNTFLVGVTSHTANPEVNYYRPEGEVGITGPSDLVQVTRRSVGLSMEIAPVYEQIHYLLEMIFGTVSATDTSGVGTGPYERIYNAPLYTTIDPAFYTIGRGQSGLYYLYESCAISQITFNYDQDTGLTASVELLAKKETTGTWTSIARPEGMTPIPVMNAQIFIDAPSAAFGTTALPGVLRSAQITINPNLHYKYFPGSIDAQGYGMRKWEVSVSATFEMKASIKALYDEVLTTPPDVPEKKVRVAFDKDANNQLRFDLVSIMKVGGDVWGDADGNVTLDLTFDAAFDATSWFQVYLLNTVA